MPLTTGLIALPHGKQFQRSHYRRSTHVAPPKICGETSGSDPSASGRTSDSRMILAMNGPDAIALTRALLRFDTVNPPGRERECARHVGALLADGGFTVDYQEYAEGRTSVIARAGGSERK